MNISNTFEDFVSVYRCQTQCMRQRELISAHKFDANEAKETIFHYIEHGSCIASGKDFEIRATEGDILVFPHGITHLLINANNERSNTVSIISGRFRIEQYDANPLLQRLPQLIVVNDDEQKKHKGLIHLIDIMVEEVDRAEFGSQSIVNRCAEAILVHLLRKWSTLEDRSAGIMNGFSDPRISKALSAFHAHFSDNWTLDQLAQEAGISRSAFANLFRIKMGITPIAYITQWRMQWAATRIREQQCKISTVALQSGYRSEVSFSRAFKAHFGYSPSSLKHKLHAA